MIVISEYNSKLGKILIAIRERKLVGLWFLNQKYFLSTINEKTIIDDKNLEIIRVKKWLDRYFKGENPSIKDIKIDLIGTEFRIKVWNYLLKIPYGKIISYKQVAKDLNCLSYQAIGGAIAHNPISIIVPCHRVVGQMNNLTGYAGGVEKKRSLLELEGVKL